MIGVLALVPVAFTAFTSSAQAQGCAGVGVTGEVCSVENNPAEELQRRSDEQDRQAREQYEAQQRQLNETYDEADRRERERAATQARRRDEGNNQAFAAQHRSAPTGAGTGYARQPTRPATPPGPAQLSTNPSVAAYQRGDYPLAFTLTREQARKGDLNAWHNLGIFYEKGIGTRADPALALQWFRPCADLGSADCQVELARLNYIGGSGLARDPVEAYKWLLLAGRQSATARKFMPEVRDSLSYQQLVEATRRYQEWKPSAAVRTPDSLPARSRH
jgi:hypothetical protein